VEQRYVATGGKRVGVDALVARYGILNGRPDLQLERLAIHVDLAKTDERRTHRLDTPLSQPAKQLGERGIDCRGHPSSVT
jgi:hypothetical protein